MNIRITHAESGKTFLIPITQLLLMSDNGEPLALAYETAGLMIYSDVTHADFSETLKSSGMKP